jgi:hypothetical protein
MPKFAAYRQFLRRWRALAQEDRGLLSEPELGEDAVYERSAQASGVSRLADLRDSIRTKCEPAPVDAAGVTDRISYALESELLMPADVSALVRAAFGVFHPDGLWHRLRGFEGESSTPYVSADDVDSAARHAVRCLDRWVATRTVLDHQRSLLHIRLCRRPAAIEFEAILAKEERATRETAALFAQRTFDRFRRATARESGATRAAVMRRRRDVVVLYPALLSAGMRREQIAALVIESGHWRCPPCPRFAAKYDAAPAGVDQLMKLIDMDIQRSGSTVRRPSFYRSAARRAK